jgi:ankyrin repeat protein
MRYPRLFVSIILLLVVANAMSTTEFYYSKIDGSVRDRSSNKPVPGALVLASWKATSGTHAISFVCTYIEAAVTDKSGNFHFSVQPSKMRTMNQITGREMKGGYPEFRVYAPGMTVEERGGLVINNDAKKFNWNPLRRFVKRTEIATTVEAKLSKSVADAHDRTRELFILSRPEPDCKNFSDAAPIKLFYQSISKEAKSLVQTPYEKALAKIIENRATAHLGPNAKDPDFLPAIEGLIVDSAGDLDQRNREDKTALMVAATDGDVSKVERLLNAGANPNRMTFWGHTALSMAIGAYGSDSDRKPGSERFLLVIKSLLANKQTDPNYEAVSLGRTLLSEASMRNQDDVVAMLLNAGANPNLYYWDDTSPLELAEKNGSEVKIATGLPVSPRSIRVYELILASPRLSAAEKTRALMRAIGRDNITQVRQLIAAGVDINAGTGPDSTPLTYATDQAIRNRPPRNVAVLRLIASTQGVDRQARPEKKTAEEMARAAGRDDLVEILQ